MCSSTKTPDLTDWHCMIIISCLSKAGVSTSTQRHCSQASHCWKADNKTFQGCPNQGEVDCSTLPVHNIARKGSHGITNQAWNACMLSTQVFSSIGLVQLRDSILKVTRLRWHSCSSNGRAYLHDKCQLVQRVCCLRLVKACGVLLKAQAFFQHLLCLHATKPDCGVKHFVDD